MKKISFFPTKLSDWITVGGTEPQKILIYPWKKTGIPN